MTEKKDVILSPAMDTKINTPNLSAVSDIANSQLVELQRTFQNIPIYQNPSMFDSLTALSEKVQEMQELLMPTQELMKAFCDTITNSINITSFQSISKSLTLQLKSINSIAEIHEDAIRTIRQVEEINEGTSCLVSMSAGLEEQSVFREIKYSNTVNIEIKAEVRDIKEDQKKMLAKMDRLEKIVDAKIAIPATITDIKLSDKTGSILEVNGKIIQFRKGVAPVILYVFLGRKNFSKTKSCEVADFYKKYEAQDWFDISKDNRKKFQNKVYQSIRHINNRFAEVSDKGEKLILQNGNNSYILNPKLFK